MATIFHLFYCQIYEIMNDNFEDSTDNVTDYKVEEDNTNNILSTIDKDISKSVKSSLPISTRRAYFDVEDKYKVI